MSYIQPLITSAFSSYTVNYTARHTAGAVRNSGSDIGSEISVVSGNSDSGKGVSGAGVSGIETDDGKPRSASGDVLDLSERAKVETNDNEIPLAGSLKSAEKSEEGKSGTPSSVKNDDELTDAEKQQVEELKSRDAEVRLHESRHVAVGGAHVTGGPSYTYQTGPDGKKYAIGGEVGVDVSPVDGDPEATIQKMQTVAAAALAPAEPSSQDQKVAAEARQTEAQARAELSKQEAGTEQSDASQSSSISSSIEESEDNTKSDGTAQTADSNSDTQFAADKSESVSAGTNTPSITSHYTKSFAAGSIGKMVSGQTSGTRFSAFA
ncbi:hypothetical protein FACS189427_08340 [Planctomycetales bacterium]|nr:hypothetical protein FACS189427_08340 [Planctomycetales bacterium]